MYSPRWLFFIPGFSMIAIGLLLAATLFFGPVKIFGDVILDIDSFISACFLVIVGVQFVSFGALSRSYAAMAGYLSRNTGSMTVLRHLTTDRLALGGALLVAARGCDVRRRSLRLGAEGIRPASGSFDPAHRARRHDSDRYWFSGACNRFFAGNFRNPEEYVPRPSLEVSFC